MPTGITYTAVELCTYENDISKAWFVYFDVTDLSTGVTVRKQFRGGINYSKSERERLSAGLQLKKYWEDRLKHGWSPFVNSGANSLSRMRFSEALDWALEKCQVASKTKLDYALTVKYFKAAAKKLHFETAIISTIKRQQIMLMLDQVKTDRKWSNHAYNKNIVYLSGVISRLVQYEVIEHNPATKIKRLPTAETNKFETMTESEQIIVKDYLTKNHPAFFTYLMLIYFAGIRPKEILALRISDIYFDRKLIIIKPDLINENSKTKTIRMVPLDKHLEALLRHHLDGWQDISLYVFGSPNCAGGNRGSEKGGISGAMRLDYFKPSHYRMKRDTATKLWKRIIIDGLGINKYQYALKHLGANKKILAGISLDALQKMYGHSSKLMTEKYANEIRKVYNREIIELSPDF